MKKRLEYNDRSSFRDMMYEGGGDEAAAAECYIRPPLGSIAALSSYPKSAFDYESLF